MTELSASLGRNATLDDVTDTELDRIACRGFDWIWLLCIWENGVAGRRVASLNAEWRKGFVRALPDVGEMDIGGSGFSIVDYTVRAEYGGEAALVRLRERLQRRGMRLMLDFVPNHTALDHRWAEEHPEYYMLGSEKDLARMPLNYIRMECKGGSRIFAYGRDPHFPGWPDTLQLDYGNPAVCEAMAGELTKVSGQCDGVCCDMAMLVLPFVFERTWGRRAQPFWRETVRKIRQRVPDFLFMAEVYWDLEDAMYDEGFNYAYDKRLYDKLCQGHGRAVRDRLLTAPESQGKFTRFLENHDEPRATEIFPHGPHEAAAVITFLSPGMRLFQKGQLEGYAKRSMVHLTRAASEEADGRLAGFYERLLTELRRPTAREGEWMLLKSDRAWEEDWSWDSFVAWAWIGRDGRRLLIIVNYSPNNGQCYVRVPFADLVGRRILLRDFMGQSSYERKGDELFARGLYVDLPAWGYHAFDMIVENSHC